MKKLKILVLPRLAFLSIKDGEFIKPSDDIAIISISSLGNPIQDVNNFNILQVEFNDDSHSFDETHALKIKKFVDKNKEKDKFIIHCDAGVSRSGAIGKWLVKYLNGDYEFFLRMNPNILPNAHVIRIMNEIGV